VTVEGGRTIIRTTQALDWRLGAGAADFSNALTVITSVGAHNFTSGGVRLVDPVNQTLTVGATGWDFNTLSLSSGEMFAYEIDVLLHADDLFALSVAWFTEAAYQASLGTDTPDVNLESATFGSFLNLNLRVYLKSEIDDPYSLYAESVSLYNAVELLEFALPYDAYLRFEVMIDGVVYNFTGVDGVDYGIAWQTSAVPEPSAYVAVLGAIALLIAISRRRMARR
jgi:hypothetical protein